MLQSKGNGVIVNLSNKEKDIIIDALSKLDSKQSIALSKKIERSKKQIKPRSAKNKGSSYQKKVCEYISQITNIPLIKGDECLIQSRGMGQQGTDVVLYGKARKLFPYGIECKNCNTISLPLWVKQAKANAIDGKYLLFIKSALLEDEIVVMRTKDFLNEMGKQK